MVNAYNKDLPPISCINLDIVLESIQQTMVNT